MWSGLNFSGKDTGIRSICGWEWSWDFSCIFRKGSLLIQKHILLILLSVPCTSFTERIPTRENFSGEWGDRRTYGEYFRATLENLKVCRGIHTLGHLDYVVRYGLHKGEEYSYRDFADEIDAVLKELIERQIGLELNTGGLKYGLGYPNPHPDVLARYRELGGEIITVGSDAHVPEYVGYRFDTAAELLKACGFHYYTEFRRKKPVFLKIP